jgi:tRNA1Val (adenine37-N6)-methyltransferase
VTAECLSTDTFFNGRIRIAQYRSGYRFSLDAVLLAHHVQPRPADRVVDLGTGCGIIPLMLAYRHPGTQIWGVEIQAPLAQIAARNVAQNNLQRRITVLSGDVRALPAGQIPPGVDVVVCNPPYRKLDSGRINPEPQRALARHEFNLTLAEVVASACRMLCQRGRLVVIYPAERTVELLCRMQQGGLEPKSVRTIHAQAATEAKLILVEGAKGGRPGLQVAPPLVVYRPDGEYTEEVRAMLGPDPFAGGHCPP